MPPPLHLWGRTGQKDDSAAYKPEKVLTTLASGGVTLTKGTSKLACCSTPSALFSQEIYLRVTKLCECMRCGVFWTGKIWPKSGLRVIFKSFFPYRIFFSPPRYTTKFSLALRAKIHNKIFARASREDTQQNFRSLHAVCVKIQNQIFGSRFARRNSIRKFGSRLARRDSRRNFARAWREEIV